MIYREADALAATKGCGFCPRPKSPVGGHVAFGHYKPQAEEFPA